MANVEYKTSSITVLAAPEVIELMVSETLHYNRHNLETGGILIGKWLDPETVFLVKATGSGPAAEHARYSFAIDTDHANSQLQETITRHPGADYIGEWHRHPGKLTRPSQGDLKTAQNLLADPTYPDRLVNPILTVQNGQVKINFYYLDRTLDDFVPLEEYGRMDGQDEAQDWEQGSYIFHANMLARPAATQAPTPVEGKLNSRLRLTGVLLVALSLGFLLLLLALQFLAPANRPVQGYVSSTLPPTVVPTFTDIPGAATSPTAEATVKTEVPIIATAKIPDTLPASTGVTPAGPTVAPSIPAIPIIAPTPTPVKATAVAGGALPGIQPTPDIKPAATAPVTESAATQTTAGPTPQAAISGQPPRVKIGGGEVALGLGFRVRLDEITAQTSNALAARGGALPFMIMTKVENLNPDEAGSYYLRPGSNFPVMFNLNGQHPETVTSAALQPGFDPCIKQANCKIQLGRNGANGRLSVDFLIEDRLVNTKYYLLTITKGRQ
ncbi:MAG TPA: Mov34/MPN/PAD-1 family protein [Chloroflexia bacterium]|nr:Mov34/MPN/PAD-1 family protein [Chloroflexia bacterium]